MRQFLTFSILVISIHCHSQCLVGTWDGTCITDDGKYQTKIIIVFELSRDSSYVITGTSEVKNENGKDTIIVTKMNYKGLSNKVIVLTEVKRIDIDLDTEVTCYQEMELQAIGFRKRCDELTGKWFCKENKSTFGYVRLIKRRPKGIPWGS